MPKTDHHNPAPCRFSSDRIVSVTLATRVLAAFLLIGSLGFLISNAIPGGQESEETATPAVRHTYSFPSPPILLRSPVSGVEWTNERKPAGDARLASVE